VATFAGSYFYSLVVTDSAGHALTIPFTQNVSPIALAPDVLPAGTVGVPYSVSLIPAGTTAPYTIQMSPASDLPPALTWDPSGVLSGTPNAAGLFTFIVFVSDGDGNFLTMIYKVTIGT